MKVNNHEVGYRINSIRKDLGLNQEEFGKRISNAHKSLVSKWEKGQSLPNNERLKIIAEIGGISVNELLYGSIRESIKTVYNRLKNGLFTPDFSYYESNPRIDILYNADNPVNSPIFNVPEKDEEKIFRVIEDMLKDGISADRYPDEEYIATIIVIALTKRYRESNRNNQNNIKIALTELINLKEKIMHRYFVDHYSIDDNSDGMELVLQDGFDKNLYHEMNGIFNEAINKLTELQKKYPD